MTRTSPWLSWSMAPTPAGPGFPLPHCWVDIEFQCALWKRDQPRNFPISCMVIMQRRYPIVQNTFYSLDYQTLFFEETHFAILKITKRKMSSTRIETLLKKFVVLLFPNRPKNRKRPELPKNGSAPKESSSKPLPKPLGIRANTKEPHTFEGSSKWHDQNHI